jgi:hypothetical protein
LGSHFYFVANRRTSDYERDHFATDRRGVVIYGALASRRSHSDSVDAKDETAGLAFSIARRDPSTGARDDDREAPFFLEWAAFRECR